MTIKPWMVGVGVLAGWAWWTRRGLTAEREATAAAPGGQVVAIWQTFRAQPAGNPEVESRSSGTESDMRATKAAVEANGGTFRYYQLTV